MATASVGKICRFRLSALRCSLRHALVVSGKQIEKNAAVGLMCACRYLYYSNAANSDTH